MKKQYWFRVSVSEIAKGLRKCHIGDLEYKFGNDFISHTAINTKGEFDVCLEADLDIYRADGESDRILLERVVGHKVLEIYS